MSIYIYGMHETPPSSVMSTGWVVHPIEVGHSGEDHPGIQFPEIYGNICRIQHAYDGGGTYPVTERENYYNRVKTLVYNSSECCRWIIGNEPNHSMEWAGDHEFEPDEVGEIFTRCANEIHALPGHAHDEVLIPPVGPWNVEIGIDWITYFKEMIKYCHGAGGFALHTYSRGPDPASIVSEAKMSPPYDGYYYGFRTYRDWLNAIPQSMRTLPVYITEANQNQPWFNGTNTWVQAAYKEIDEWNHSGGQIVRALCLYRWPKYDQYAIDGKTEVHLDFMLAQSHKYTWKIEQKEEIEATITISGKTFSGTLKEV